MKAVLINPRIADSMFFWKQDYFSVESKAAVWPPLGLLYIAAFVKSKEKHAVSLIDMEAEGLSVSRLKERIRESQPDVVGIYTTTFSVIDVFLIARAVKEIDPGIHISLGGPHVNIYPEETIANADIDSVVLGEGEITFLSLLDALEQQNELSGIPGILYKERERVIRTAPPGPAQSLDEFPFPDRAMVPYKLYDNVFANDSPSTSMISSRGCGYRCIFCYRPPLETRVRFRSSRNVLAEMEECLSLGMKDIFFYDETFTLDQPRVTRICNGIIDRNMRLRWGMRTRVDAVDYEMLRKLKAAGCERIHFGVEAGTPRVLSVLNKGISIPQIKEAFRLSRKAGIETLGYFMLGSPSETRKDMLETIDLAVALNPDYAYFSLTLPLPDTMLYRKGLEEGVFTHDFWKEFAADPHVRFSPQLWEEHLTKDELRQMLRYATRRFYFRPRYLIGIASKQRSLREFKKKMKIGLELFISAASAANAE